LHIQILEYNKLLIRIILIIGLIIKDLN